MGYFGLYYQKSFILRGMLECSVNAPRSPHALGECDTAFIVYHPIPLNALFSSEEKKVLPDQHRPF